MLVLETLSSSSGLQEEPCFSCMYVSNPPPLFLALLPKVLSSQCFLYPLMSISSSLRCPFNHFLDTVNTSIFESSNSNLRWSIFLSALLTFRCTVLKTLTELSEFKSGRESIMSFKLSSMLFIQGFFYLPYSIAYSVSGCYHEGEDKNEGEGDG